MKKTIALVLCLLMVVSLAACGGQVSGIDESTTSTEETETAETQNAETQTSEETEAESTQTENVVWTLDEIPRPSESAGESYGENAVGYILQKMTKETAEERLNDYEERLIAAGFEIEVTENEGDRRISIATSGNARVDITFEKEPSATNEYYAIDVYIAVEVVEQQELNMEALIPELPEGQWHSTDGEDEYWYSYQMECEQLTLEDVEDYVQTLQNAGYDKNVTIGPMSDNELYHFEGYSHDTPLTMVTVLLVEIGQENDSLYTIVNIKVAKE